MSLIMSLTVGVLFATGVYCLLRRSLMRLVVGIVLLGPLLADALLSTSGGNVTATVQEEISFHLDARTSGGNVKADGITIKIDSGGSW